MSAIYIYHQIQAKLSSFDNKLVNMLYVSNIHDQMQAKITVAVNSGLIIIPYQL